MRSNPFRPFALCLFAILPLGFAAQEVPAAVPFVQITSPANESNLLTSEEYNITFNYADLDPNNTTITLYIVRLGNPGEVVHEDEMTGVTGSDVSRGTFLNYQFPSAGTYRVSVFFCDENENIVATDSVYVDVFDD